MIALVLRADSGALAQAQAEQPDMPLSLTNQASVSLLYSHTDPQQIKRILYQLGQRQQSIGNYREAATEYETLASKFPGEVDSGNEAGSSARIDIPGALEQAALFRRGLGETEKSLEDVHLFIKNYGGRKEFFSQAAGVFFDASEVYEQRKDYDKLKQHLIEYLRTWAEKGGSDRKIVAEAKLGELAWRSSCPVPGTSGACIDVKRERSRPSLFRRSGSWRDAMLPFCQRPLRLGPCAPETKALITVHARKPALLKEAMAHFQTALMLNGSTAIISSQPGRRQIPQKRLDSLNYYVALARMAQGDVLYEELMRMQPPRGLVFNPEQKHTIDGAEQRFSSWMTLKRRKLDEAKARYAQVMGLKNSYFTIAATARIGQLYLAFANGLYRAEIPAPSPPPSASRSDKECPGKRWIQMTRDAFCDHMVDTAEPLELLAKEHLLQCIRNSGELGELSEWSRLCEEELYQLDPYQYPLPSEIHVEPGTAPASMNGATPQSTDASQ